jgi:hypothetical protein
MRLNLGGEIAMTAYRLEHWRSMPLYYFEPEGPGWDYQDDDGIELPNNAEALAYAHQLIRELKEDGKILADITHLLVKDTARKIIFRISTTKRFLD